MKVNNQSLDPPLDTTSGFHHRTGYHDAVTLANGSKIGPYEILSPLGAGGMGEVYRARDTRLDRIVAVKVLGSRLSVNDTVRARFELEARAISALSHPNICSLYDIGNDAGVEYLVMECLEGETLSARIARGPLPVSQILRYGSQIAEALHHAHRTKITHRDLKPGNIMITASGAKLLDFGLAKLIEPLPQGSSQNSLPTHRLDPLTAEGTVVGTIQYMSPEQLEGKTIDHRTDIFSLGVILYEMVTGMRPFQGGSPASLMAAILSSDPAPIRSMQPSAPPALERIIVTALEKDPDERWQTAHDVARQLRWISEASTSGESAVEKPVAPRRFGVLAMVFTAMLATFLLTWGGMRMFSKAPRRDAARLQFAPPSDLQLVHSFDVNVFAISPDGRTLCFLASNGESSALYLRDLDSLEVKKVEGSESGSGPFWSSDGEWIAFSARGRLWKTKATGGALPEAICETTAGGAVGSWIGNTILFADRLGGRPEILRVSAQGGKAVAVTTVKKGEWRHSWPYLLSDGEHFLYHSLGADSFERQIILASLTSPKESTLIRDVSQARVVGGDQLVYVREGKMMAQRFDLAKGLVLGEELLASDVAYFLPTARAEFDASPGGVIAYHTDTSTGRLAQVDRGGKEIQLIDDKGPFWDHNLTADGRKAAVSVRTRATGLMDIWIYDLTRRVRDRFTSEPGMEFAPVWSPDGRSIIYSATQGGALPHLVRRSLSASVSEPVLPPGPFLTAGSFSPDGSRLFYEQFDPRTRNDIFSLTLKTGASEPILNSKIGEGQPESSPDGKWLAFASDATGASEIYLRSLSDVSLLPIRVSIQGGRSPSWRQDGQELFFLAPDDGVMSAVPRAPGHWDDATIHELFRAPSGMRGFEAMPDGQSFLISYDTPGATDSMFQVILGWQ